MSRTIALVGGAIPTNLIANRIPKGVELWGMNLDHRFLFRPADRWFQIHPRDWHDDQNQRFGRGTDHLLFLQKCNVPVYMKETQPDIPMSVRYPIGEVVVRFGKYLTSSAAYMIALALYEGCDRLELYGIHMATATEFVTQRACMEYYLGIAEGMGIETFVPDECPLLKAPLYAYEDGISLSQTPTLALAGA